MVDLVISGAPYREQMAEALRRYLPREQALLRHKRA
jgi:hypothetical protein